MNITIATGDYAHTRPLLGARLEAGGDGEFEVRWICDRPAAIFRRTFDKDRPFDVAEMSLATAWTLPDRGITDFLALPVFPSRMSRLSAFYVRNGISRPEDLAGGRVGLMRFGQTAAVWSRAWLQHRFGIDSAGIEWWVAERQPFEPERANIREAPDFGELETMLAESRLDCLVATSVPAVFVRGRVRRLFPDWAAQERTLYSDPCSVPIMHTLLIRRSLAEKFPRLPSAVCRGFCEAKRGAFAWLRDTDASSLPIPLQHGWVEEALEGGRKDPWPYGLAANHAVLTEFADHLHEQGLTRRRTPPGEVFLDVS